MIGLHTLHTRAARVLPAALRTCAVLSPPLSHSDLVELVLPLRHRGSGVIRFRLCADAERAMRDPAADPTDAPLRAREGLGRRAAALVYAPWRLLHVALPAGAASPADQSSGGGPAPADARVEVHVTRSVDGRARLVVIPALHVAIYSWWDRGCGGRRRERLR